jgi:hypothetical protein
MVRQLVFEHVHQQEIARVLEAVDDGARLEQQQITGSRMIELRRPRMCSPLRATASTTAP